MGSKTIHNDKKEIKLLFFSSKRREKIIYPLENEINFEIIKMEYEKNIIKSIYHILKKTLTNIIKNDFDIILCDSPGKSLFLSYITKILTKKPLIMRLRGDVWTERNKSKNILGKIRSKTSLFFTNYILKKIEYIIPVSNYLKNLIIKKLKIDKNKIKVIKLPITKKIVKRNKSEILLTITNFEFKEKVDGFLDHLPIINEILELKPEIKFYVLGDGKYLNYVKNNIKNKKHIIFPGFKNNIHNYLSKSMAFIYFSGLDAYPNTIIEAMASGIPVISNDACGIKEQVENGKTGVIIKNKRLTDNNKKIIKKYLMMRNIMKK